MSKLLEREICTKRRHEGLLGESRMLHPYPFASFINPGGPLSREKIVNSTVNLEHATASGELDAQTYASD
ncbi:hypothetical protein FOXG_15883 [Fusarium oxysporum f. sp. lycopersici 4287]|uniref:Uncharacterized protein n=2 Tax=Fusarium oxysporum TaxID=5507 RepID=A0A0J9W5W8_FUSO4|nr:hypothetical protein FOXG_15883 [Fusarium oxysporum f. sp. lycopersici 4287]KAI8417194.1 hypothetical protein FOFC_03507 [Fusarium oxysporum]KNB18464.1 hypothetical protein FOXG_15883 [Fusarium oxysporum f. sp. lycopersici 4287]